EVAPRSPVSKGVYVVSVEASALLAPPKTLGFSPSARTMGESEDGRKIVYGGKVLAFDPISRTFGLEPVAEPHTTSHSTGKLRPTCNIPRLLLSQPTLTFDEKTVGKESIQEGVNLIVEVE